MFKKWIFRDLNFYFWHYSETIFFRPKKYLKKINLHLIERSSQRVHNDLDSCVHPQTLFHSFLWVRTGRYLYFNPIIILWNFLKKQLEEQNQMFIKISNTLIINKSLVFKLSVNCFFVLYQVKILLRRTCSVTKICFPKVGGPFL